MQARRADDWDFTPKGHQVIGNTGVGYWSSGFLSAKWCVGYKAWQMDALMAIPDLERRGERAMQLLHAALSSSDITAGVKVEIRAVQRFQSIQASDGVWEDGTSSHSIDMDSLIAAWRKEIGLLRIFHARRGQEVSAAEALKIKKETYGLRCPDAPSDMYPHSMRTAHKTWKIFAALDVFVTMDPQRFFDVGDVNHPVKNEHLDKINRVVQGLGHFAEAVSGK